MLFDFNCSSCILTWQSANSVNPTWNSLNQSSLLLSFPSSWNVLSSHYSLSFLFTFPCHLLLTLHIPASILYSHENFHCFTTPNWTPYIIWPNSTLWFFMMYFIIKIKWSYMYLLVYYVCLKLHFKSLPAGSGSVLKNAAVLEPIIRSSVNICVMNTLMLFIWNSSDIDLIYY